MADKKNIVIKVKYPATGKKTEKYAPPKTVTEWNIKRIAFAAAILTVVLAGLLYLLMYDGVEQQNDRQNASLPPDTTANSSEQRAIAANNIAAPDNQPKTGDEVGNVQPSINQGAITQIDKPSIKPEQALEKPQTQSIKLDDAVKNQPVTSQPEESVAVASPPVKVNKNVSRALLTYKVKNREPMTEIPRTVIVDKTKPTVVHYFTEVEGMKGQNIYHEWIRNGKVVTRYKLDVGSDAAWRTYSHMSVSEKGLGNWTVRLLDAENNLLNQQAFRVNAGK